MAKAVKKSPPKKRGGKYEEKVSFKGTFEDMVKVSVKHAERKKEDKKTPDR